jgi:hypothetical protein
LLNLAGLPDSMITVPPPVTDPVPHLDKLRQMLFDATPEAVRKDLPEPSANVLDLTDLLQRTAGNREPQVATLLAAGYLKGDMARPIIPFVRQVPRKL